MPLRGQNTTYEYRNWLLGRRHEAEIRSVLPSLHILQFHSPANIPDDFCRLIFSIRSFHDAVEVLVWSLFVCCPVITINKHQELWSFPTVDQLKPAQASRISCFFQCN